MVAFFVACVKTWGMIYYFFKNLCHNKDMSELATENKNEKEGIILLRHRQVLKYMEEKGSTLGQALRKAGYGKDVMRAPSKVTNTKSWKALLKEHYLGDDALLRAHKRLLVKKTKNYIVFPNDMTDREIEDKCWKAGIDVLTIQDGGKGKFAFYTEDDVQAQKSALDMAYKIKGEYAKTGGMSLTINVSQEKEDLAYNAILEFVQEAEVIEPDHEQ